MSRLLTVPDVAARTRVDESTLYTWRHRGIGPMSFRLNGRVVYDEDIVEAWIAAQRDNTSKGSA